MNIEKEVEKIERDDRSGLGAQHVDDNDKRKRKKKKEGRGFTSDSLLQEGREKARIKGYLEINPYVCSGCGASFQSKESHAPGFLPKEKLQDHRVKAVKIREKQDAIKILDMAGIELDSDAAESILTASDISKDVIKSVRNLGKGIQSPAHPLLEDDYDEDEAFREWEEEFGGEDDNRTNHFDDPIDGIDISLDELFADRVNSGVSLVDALQKKIENAASSSMTTTISTKPSGLRDFSSEHVNDISGEVENSNSLEMEGNDFEDQVNMRGKGEMAAADELSDAVCICQRCYRLQQYGQVEEALRPGWSDHELLTPERFEGMLGGIKDRSIHHYIMQRLIRLLFEKRFGLLFVPLIIILTPFLGCNFISYLFYSPAVVCCIIDLFDLQVSCLYMLGVCVLDDLTCSFTGIFAAQLANHRRIQSHYHSSQ